MDQLPTRAKILTVRAITVDCTTIGVRCEITDGPRSLIGRTLDLVITPERQVEIPILQDLLGRRQKVLDSRKEGSVISKV